MINIIHAKLPKNTSGADLALFDKFLVYEVSELKILNLRNVFVTYSGLTLSESGLIPECHHKELKAFVNNVNDAFNYVRYIEENPIKLIHLEDERVYLQIHHPWSHNYWHWMTEAILRIWLVRDVIQNMVLLIPNNLMLIPFVKETLRHFHFAQIFVIPSGNCLQVQNLTMPEIKPVMDSYYSDHLIAIARYFRKCARVNWRDKKCSSERIYISREKSQRRRVINENDVIALLIDFGFQVVYVEDYAFQEQVQIFSRAKCLISLHGAGLTNLMFMKRGSKILEFHKRKTNGTDWHSFAFWYMSDAMGFEYYHQICEPLDLDEHFVSADVSVDLSTLAYNLVLMNLQ